MSSWLHRLFHPHCPHCREERICNSCEILKVELEAVRFQNKQLLDTILDYSKPRQAEPAIITNPEELRPITPKHIPWNVRREMLEGQSKVKLRQLQEQEELNQQNILTERERLESTEKLEKQLGVNDASK